MENNFFHKISDNLYLIKGKNSAKFPYCNTILWEETKNGKYLVAFDPQCGKKLLRSGVKMLGKTLSDIKYVINTHFHIDHSLSNYLFQKKGSKILIHEEDFKVLTGIDEYLSRYGMWSDQEVKERFIEFLQDIGFQSIIPDRKFKEGEILPGNFEVIHTPGHSPGHCSFLKENILIAGDIDLKSPWVGNLTSDVGDFIKSIKKIQKLDIEIFLPSHSDPEYGNKNISEKLVKYIQKFPRMEEHIFNSLTENPISMDLLIERMEQKRTSNNPQNLKQQQISTRQHFQKMKINNYLIHMKEIGRIKEVKINEESLWKKN